MEDSDLDYTLTEPQITIEQAKPSFLPRNRYAIIENSPEGVEYTCVECSAKYQDKEKLELHLVLHYKEYRFVCEICGAGLKRKEHLERHTLGHQEIRPHICEECGKGFKRKEHLTIHRAIHSGAKDQVCPFCHRSFYRKDHLQKHLQTHSKLLEGLDPTDEQLQVIKLELNFDGEGQEMETEEFDQEANMYESVQVDPERPFACDQCGKTYKRKDHLKMHYVSHKPKQLTCSECGKSFQREEHLLIHMKVHLTGLDGGEEPPVNIQTMFQHNADIEVFPLQPLLVERAVRPHECPVCGRRFKRRQHLISHGAVHARGKPYMRVWCGVCHLGFQTNADFESHQCSAVQNDEAAFAHSDAAPHGRKENCPMEFVECDISEEQSTQHDQTQNAAPDERLIPTPQRVYVCKYCNKPFKRKDHYKIHLHIHTGIKSFFCPECGKGFYRKDHLQKHVLIHGRARGPAAARRPPPALLPLRARTNDVMPEITITAPSNSKLRLPLQMKVPYQMVCADGGERIVHPNA